MTSPLPEVVRYYADRHDGDPTEAAQLTERVLRRAEWRRRRGVRECQRCHVDKPPSEFSRDSRSSDGLRRYCRSCQRRQNARRSQ